MGRIFLTKMFLTLDYCHGIAIDKCDEELRQKNNQKQ